MNTDKALAILPFVGVAGRDESGQVVAVAVPAAVKFEGGKRGGPRVAVVRVRRQADGAVGLACTHYAADNDADEGTPCPAADSPHPCYHCLATLYVLAGEASADLYLHADRGRAQAACEQGGPGRWMRVDAGRAVFFAVVKPRGKARPAHQPAAPAGPPPAPAPVVSVVGDRGPAVEVITPATVRPVAPEPAPVPTGNPHLDPMFAEDPTLAFRDPLVVGRAKSKSKGKAPTRKRKAPGK